MSWIKRFEGAVLGPMLRHSDPIAFLELWSHVERQWMKGNCRRWRVFTSPGQDSNRDGLQFMKKLKLNGMHWILVQPISNSVFCHNDILSCLWNDLIRPLDAGSTKTRKLYVVWKKGWFDLSTASDCHCFRCPDFDNSVEEKSSHDNIRSRVRYGDSLWSSCESIDASQQVGKTLRWQQRLQYTRFTCDNFSFTNREIIIKQIPHSDLDDVWVWTRLI